MTRRGRRLVGALLAIVAALFVGRWIVAFVTEDWWAATISPDAATFVAQWQLIAVALDIGAVAVASLWFALQALLVARAIASVQVTQHLGNLQLRQTVPVRWLFVAAVAAGILLGLIAGGGAHDWRGPMALAWQGVHYGVTDPILHADFGVFVAKLPAWDLLLGFATLLATLGLAFCLALYAGIGALRREGRTIQVHPDARRHLGALCAIVALVIAAGYWILPYHLALDQGAALTDAAAAVRIRGAEIAAGVACATAALSLAWGWRERHAFLVSGWAVLAVAAISERFIIPLLDPAGSIPPGRVALARTADSLAWGFHMVAAAPEPASEPAVTALWDEPMFQRLAAAGGGILEAASATSIATASGTVPVWLVAWSPPQTPPRLAVTAVVDGVTATLGGDSLLAGPDRPPGARSIWRSVAAPRVLPSAGAWRSARVGVNASDFARRLILAWARQEPGMLARSAGPAVDWHLDPSERAAAILPMFTWLPPDVAVVDGLPMWVVQGLVLQRDFPLATRIRWRNQPISGASPAVICIINPVTGATGFYLDPAADATGRAWAAMVGPLVHATASLPTQVIAHLGYAAESLQMQAAVLGSTRWTRGTVPLSAAPVVSIWVASGRPGRQIALEDPAGNVTTAIVSASRFAGQPQLRVDAVESEATPVPGHLDVHRQFSRESVVVHLVDSVTASGDSAIWRGVRWRRTGQRLVAWQPLFAVPRHGWPSPLWLGIAAGDRVAGGRTPAGAWLDLAAPAQDTARGPADAVRLQQARLWLERADSAFRRGDLTAFGRAFEQLRSTLQRKP